MISHRRKKNVSIEALVPAARNTKLRPDLEPRLQDDTVAEDPVDRRLDALSHAAVMGKK